MFFHLKKNDSFCHVVDLRPFIRQEKHLSKDRRWCWQRDISTETSRSCRHVRILTPMRNATTNVDRNVSKGEIILGGMNRGERVF
jgi:hypothetical protein